MATKFTTPAPIGTDPVNTITLAPPAQPGTSTVTETRFLAVDDGRIAYDDTGGSGALILAIPGMGDLRSEYRLLRPALQRAGYRVVTMVCAATASHRRGGRTIQRTLLAAMRWPCSRISTRIRQ